MRRTLARIAGALAGEGGARTGGGGTLARAGGAAGVAGPGVFTGAWVVSSLRQTGYGAAEVQISGLAAPGARDPWIMITGFVVLGGCCVAFGAGLRDVLGGRGRAGLAPGLIQGAGALTAAAGLLRRDRMLLVPGTVSWHNRAHDVISAVIYSELVLAQLLLAARFGRGPRGQGTGDWRAWRPWMAGGAAGTALALAAFAADTSAAWAGILQRIAVTIPLAVMAGIGARMLTTARADG
jgi:Protein of unknown function (DUF998)